MKKNLAASHPAAAVDSEGQGPAYQTEKAVAMKKVVYGRESATNCVRSPRKARPNTDANTATRYCRRWFARNPRKRRSGASMFERRSLLQNIGLRGRLAFAGERNCPKRHTPFVDCPQ